MGTIITFKRGFKAKSEKLAIEFREKLGSHAWEPLCAFQLAEFLNTKVYSAEEFLSESEFNRLGSNSNIKSEWSALTMVTKAGNRIIIHNPFHSKARQQSNIMHELAHIICEHKNNSTEFFIPGLSWMREYNKEQEEEAKYFGAALQIARPGLLWAKKRNMKTEDIATHFSASADLVKYRMNTSGVERQTSYLKNRN